jgi:CIC family chloride channel protein
VLLVTDDGKLDGIITRSDVVSAVMSNENKAPLTAIEAGTPGPFTCTAGESVHDALEVMMMGGVGRLPVVADDDPKRIVGYLGRDGILKARARKMEEENQRESGWFRKALRAS